MFDARCVKGARIAICYGVHPEPSVWYGATIDEVDLVNQTLLLAFDDAELSWRSAAELKADDEAGCLKFLMPDDGGLRDGKQGNRACLQPSELHGRKTAARLRHAQLAC